MSEATGEMVMSSAKVTLDGQELELVEFVDDEETSSRGGP